MSRFTITEPPQWSNRKVPLEIGKDPEDANMALEVKHGDTEEVMFKIRSEKRTRDIILEVFVDEDSKRKLKVVDATPNQTMDIGIQVMSAGAQALEDAPAKANYKVEDGLLKIWRGPGKPHIELKIMDKPGPMTPKSAFEVLGQDDMLFAIASAIKTGNHSMAIGPTGTGKTSAYRWLAHKLNYNLVVMPISRGTRDMHMLGEYLPTGQPGQLDWTDGPVTMAARLSQTHPTILVLEEMTRIGNVAEFSRIYSLLDDTRMLELPERRQDTGNVEQIHSGELFVGATANPADDPNVQYIGVKDLDPALNSRFAIQPLVKYPPAKVEAQTLISRVPGLNSTDAVRMVDVANAIRNSADLTFPASFRELMTWAEMLPVYNSFDDAAEVALIMKAPDEERAAIRGYLSLKAKKTKA